MLFLTDVDHVSFEKARGVFPDLNVSAGQTMSPCSPSRGRKRIFQNYQILIAF